MSTTKLVEPKAPESDEADEICQDSFALQAGAKFLFLRAIKAHASACERSDEFWRAKQFDGVDELIRYAERRPQ